jgi:hypothetical protein
MLQNRRKELKQGFSLSAFIFFGAIFALTSFSNPPEVFAQRCRNREIRASRSRNADFQRGSQWSTTSSRLVFQNDGNLVLFGGSNNVLWATGTENRADRLSIQRDGNVVLYNGNQAVWATNTDRSPGAFLALQCDGNLVVYDGRRAIWATNTRSKTQEGQNPIPRPPETTRTLWEVWLVARASENIFNYIADPGHAFIAIVKNNGSRWEVDTTFGYWPESDNNGGLPVENDKDKANTWAIINDGTNPKAISKGGWAVRKARADQGFVDYLKSEGYKKTSCNNYDVVSYFAPGGIRTCNCADYATLMWYGLYGEDFRMSKYPTLVGLVNRINSKNIEDGGFAK